MGFDPSLNNWGMAAGTYDVTSGEILIERIAVTQPIKPKGKQVRQRSKDLAAAQQLTEGAQAFLQDAQVIFVEVPVGSQNARAAAGYGICIGILGSFRANANNFLEVTPDEVKIAAVGIKTATKQQMIVWATGLFPVVGWPTRTQKGVIEIISGKAEHMADAIATIHAGVKLDSFQQLLKLRA